MKKCTFALACCALSVASTLSLAQTPAVAAPSAAQPAPAAPSADSGSPTLVGQVISRTALFQQVAIPHANCVNTPVTVQGPKSGAGAMMGAIAGAAVGSQIGGG